MIYFFLSFQMLFLMLKFWEFFIFLPPALITRLYFWCFNPLFLWIIQSFLVYCSSLLQEKKNCGWDLKQREDTNPPQPAEISLIHMGWGCTASSPVSGDGAAAENKRFSLISRFCCVSVAVVARGEEEALCNYRCNHPFPAGYRLARVTWAPRDACGRRRCEIPLLRSIESRCIFHAPFVKASICGCQMTARGLFIR